MREITSINLEEDFDGFIELCRTGFGDGVASDKAMYDWYFNQNPYNPPSGNMMYVLKENVSEKKTSEHSFLSGNLCSKGTSFAPVAPGKVIAADGLFPFELCVGGVKYKAAHSIESVTHPDYKRQGIFRTMTEHSLAKAKEYGLDIVLGLANDNSYGAYEKFGWKTLFEKRIHIRPIHIYTRLRRNLHITFLSGLIAFGYYMYDGVRRMILAGKAKGYTSECLDSVPLQAAECFERYRSKYGALIARNAIYLDYRYNRRPDQKYKTIVIRRKQTKIEEYGEQIEERSETAQNNIAPRIEGFAVVRICDLKKNKMLTVAEFFCNPDDERAVHALVKAVVNYGYGAGVEYIVLSIGGNVKIKDILAKTGFKLNTRPLLNNMMIAQDVSGRLELDSLADEAMWMITQGDGEAELHI